MRNLKLVFLFLLSFSLAISVAGCAGSKTHESTGEYFDDSILTNKVKLSIVGDPKLKSLDISVETFKGVVQLSGFVSSSEAATRAVDLARRVKGVKQVNNSLIVK
ncbi:MAG: BON domain-containing protein [Methylococcaceae bacterium]|nr:BON domain-containing protein [Methylococcaceae bacterium]